VTDIDEAELAKKLEQLDRENEEVPGDDDEDNDDVDGDDNEEEMPDAEVAVDGIQIGEVLQ
jgi:hypothetical protein